MAVAGSLADPQVTRDLRLGGAPGAILALQSDRVAVPVPRLQEGAGNPWIRCGGASTVSSSPVVARPDPSGLPVAEGRPRLREPSTRRLRDMGSNGRDTKQLAPGSPCATRTPGGGSTPGVGEERVGTATSRAESDMS